MAIRQVDQAQLASLPRAVLLDVREPAEYEGERLPRSLNIPLSELDSAPARLPKGEPIVVICRSGGRSEEAARRLAAAGMENILILAGGLACCTGLERGSGRVWAMDRQVRMAAGALVVAGLALGWLVHPAGALLSAGVGLGLMYSAASDTCGMARVLALMPWNRPRRTSQSLD